MKPSIALRGSLRANDAESPATPFRLPAQAESPAQPSRAPNAFGCGFHLRASLAMAKTFARFARPTFCAESHGSRRCLTSPVKQCHPCAVVIVQTFAQRNHVMAMASIAYTVAGHMACLCPSHRAITQRAWDIGDFEPAVRVRHPVARKKVQPIRTWALAVEIERLQDILFAPRDGYEVLGRCHLLVSFHVAKIPDRSGLSTPFLHFLSHTCADRCTHLIPTHKLDFNSVPVPQRLAQLTKLNTTPRIPTHGVEFTRLSTPRFSSPNPHHHFVLAFHPCHPTISPPQIQPLSPNDY
jgi:hypothetical protein